MYISIGGEIVIKASELVAILDFDVYCKSVRNKNFKPRTAEINIPSGQETYKSVVITTAQMYFSSLSSSTLQKRLDSTHINKHNYVYV